MNKLKLLPDLALNEENSDGLGFDAYSEVLKDAALGTPGPFTIGVFGEWGTGKTSLMQMVETKLKGKEKNKEYNLITVWFNAWRYEKEVHPILPLIATIISEINKNKSFVKKLGESGKSFVKALRAIAYGFSAKSKVKLPGFAEIEASFVAKDMIGREEKLSTDPLLDRSLYFNAFERLSEIKLPENSKIIIFVDDLDRCFPNHAIKLLESIKLILCQPGFTFFLGVARKVIEGYLEYRYSKRFGIRDFIGSEYMDKIVQLQFEIPNHQYRMGEDAYKNKIISMLDNHDHKHMINQLVPIIGPVSGGNPRRIIRFINSLLIDEAINSRSEKEPIPIKFFAVTRALQQFWREIFYLLINDDGLCEEINEMMKNDKDPFTVHTRLKDMQIRNRKNLTSIMTSDIGKSWLNDKDKRNHSNDFIERVTKYETDKPSSNSVKQLNQNFNVSFGLVDSNVKKGKRDRILSKITANWERIYNKIKKETVVWLNNEEILFYEMRYFLPALIPSTSDHLHTDELFRTLVDLELTVGVTTAIMDRYASRNEFMRRVGEMIQGWIDREISKVLDEEESVILEVIPIR